MKIVDCKYYFPLSYSYLKLDLYRVFLLQKLYTELALVPYEAMNLLNKLSMFIPCRYCTEITRISLLDLLAVPRPQIHKQ